jgi:hypothetical protein
VVHDRRRQVGTGSAGNPLTGSGRSRGQAAQFTEYAVNAADVSEMIGCRAQPPMSPVTAWPKLAYSDGHLYPCNYHPRPGGASYGSAIDSSFREVWEGIQRRRIRDDLPAICPKVCDPFKNRANGMLQVAKQIASAHGLDHLEADVAGLVASRAYDPTHTHGASTPDQ